jgi:hypothetical protein
MPSKPEETAFFIGGALVANWVYDAVQVDDDVKAGRCGIADCCVGSSSIGDP